MLRVRTSKISIKDESEIRLTLIDYTTCSFLFLFHIVIFVVDLRPTCYSTEANGPDIKKYSVDIRVTSIGIFR